MHIVHVVRQFHPFIGGLENFVLSLAQQQIAQGHTVSVITLNQLINEPDVELPAHEMLDGISIHRIGFVGPVRYAIAPAVLQKIKTADIVHVQGVDFFCDYLAATRVLHGKPMVLSTHGGYFHTSFAMGLKRFLFSTVTRLSIRQYKRIFACSQQDYDFFRPIAGSQLQLIHNGIDTVKFLDAASPTFTPSLICVGRISKNKGLLELVDSFANVARQFPASKLHIVGNDYDGTLVKLTEKIEASPYREQIVVHSGLPNEQIRELMNTCSFFVSASRYEGFGMTVIEAMAAGLIPIGNNIPAFKALIGGDKPGLLTDFSNPDRAGREMAEFMATNQKDYSAHQDRAKREASAFDWETTARRFSEAYERVLGTTKRELLGVELAVKTRREAVGMLDDAISSGDTIKVAFANAHTLNLAASDPNFRKALKQFVVLNDGLGVDIASRVHFGRSFDENLNGTDFVPHFLSETHHRLRIYLLGSTKPVIAEAARRFSERWPQHRIVGARNGFFSNPEEIDQAVEEIRSSRADVVLVGFGNPLQELWIERHADKTGAKAFLGVGALFDFTAGAVPRAPNWVRSIRCEWVYRLLQEPRRLWRRYLLNNAIFLFRVLRPPVRAGE